MTLRGLLRLWMLLDRVITELLGLDRELERELDLDKVSSRISDSKEDLKHL